MSFSFLIGFLAVSGIGLWFWRDSLGAREQARAASSQMCIRDSYSTVDLPDGMPKEIFQHLKKVRVRQVPLNISRLDGLEPDKKRPAPKRTAARNKIATDEQDAPSARKTGKRGS